MARFLSILLWTAVFCLMLLALDQLLVRLPATLPAHVAVAGFYRDLRGRVLDLATGGKPAPVPAAAPPNRKPAPSPASIETLIEQRRTNPATPSGKPAVKPAPARDEKPRYVYADDLGAIHFAETLAEIPEPFRDKARRLGE